MVKSKNTAEDRIGEKMGESRKRNVGHLNKTESQSSDKTSHNKNKNKIDKPDLARNKESGWPTKEFKLENSYLTEAYKNVDIRCIRLLCCVAWVMWMIRLIILDYSSNVPLRVPGIATILVACHGMHYWLVSHFIFLILAIVVNIGFQIWYRTRSVLSQPLRKIFDYACAVLMVGYITAYLVIPWWWMLVISDQGVLAKEFVVGEQVRIGMKIIAFLSEKIHETLEESKLQDKNKRAPRKTNSASISQLIYFCYAPTLIYRDEYPRTDSIRWCFVLENLIELVFIIYTEFLIYEIEVLPSVKSYLLEQRPSSFFLLIFQNSLPLFAMLVMGMTGLWHMMQNVFAEILRFGDRRFYFDWWNEGTPAGFHRSNNIVVQDWLFFYVYRPFRKLTGSRGVAQLAVLFLSGLVHDIMIAMALGFGLPIVLHHFVNMAVMLLIFKQGKSRDAFSNLIQLMCFPPGISFMACFLAVEYVARQECPRVIESGLDYFYPRFWGCTLNKEL